VVAGAADADPVVVRPMLPEATTRPETIVKVTAQDRTFQRDMMHPICRLDPEFSRELFTEKSAETMVPRMNGNR
jgi:hypothetical protein